MSRIEERMKRKPYEAALRKLQVELCALQEWVKQEGIRVIVLFEGRDGAGKGGTIKAITDRVVIVYSASRLCRRRRIGKRRSCTPNGTFHGSRRREKS